MTQQDRRDELRTTLDEARREPTLSTYLLRGESIGTAAVSRITLSTEVTDTVIADVLRHVERIADREFLDYDPSYQLASNQVIADDISVAPALAEVLRVVENDDVPTDPRDADTPVQAMVHRVVGGDGAAVTALRLKGPGIATRRARNVLALLANQGVFTEVRDEILFYEPRFDVVAFGSTIVVTTVTLLPRQLEAPERAQARARETFARATARIAIEGADELAEAVASDPAMVAKMMALSRLLESDPEYAELLTTETLVDFVRNNPHIEIEVVGEGEDAKLRYDRNPQKRYRIVKALADDYLSSRLSGRDYEAGSKQRL